MKTSRQSHHVFHAPLSPSASTSPLATDQDTLLSASNKSIQSSLECLNDYIQKHYDRFVAHESLERNRLITSFVEKEQSYERQISILKAIHTDIAGLLVREKAANDELRDKLDNVINSVTMLYKIATDANSVVDRKRDPHEIKQEEDSQENMNVSGICPNAASFLSQMETMVTEINTQNGTGLPLPVDTLPCHSTSEALGRVVDFLLATRRIFALLQEEVQSVGAARVDLERQNESLQEKITLLQEELKQARSDNERVSQELAVARLERERHVCRPPTPAYPTPAVQEDFFVPLPSPPLEKRDLCTPDEVLQDACNISRKTNQTPSEGMHPKNTPQTSTVKAGPSSASMSTICERRRISLTDAVKRVQMNSVSSTAQRGPSKYPVIRDDQQSTGLSMLPPPVPIQGTKRTSSGVHKCQNISKGPPPSPLISASSSSSIPDRTNDLRPKKKRRLNGTPWSSAMNQKHKPTNENLPTKLNVTHTSTAGSSASPPKHTTAQLPKTSASDLKSLKFSKSQPSKPPPTPTMATSSDTAKLIATPTKSDRLFMKPLDLAKKSPQERAVLRKSK